MMAVQILKDLDFAWAAFHFSEPEKKTKMERNHKYHI